MDQNKSRSYPEDIAKEKQDQQPGTETGMDQKPIYDDASFMGAGRLAGKVALIIGGDSGIGRAVAVAYAKEGAKVFINYKEDESEDARQVQQDVEAVDAEFGGLPGDIGDSAFCKQLVDAVIQKFGQLDIVVNNAAEQHPQDSIADITDEQLERTFRTNIFSMFYLVRASLPHLKEGSSIINTTSVTAFQGSPELIDYASTKGAIVGFTRSLSASLAEKGIRVNQIAPGPIWTPLIPATMDEEDVEGFGSNTPLGRAGQPLDLAEAYVFLAWERASSYITGQTIHINGGSFISS